MANMIKLKQKLGMDATKILQEQLKTSGVPIISAPKPGHAVTSDNVLTGKVVNIFNLGQKLEVHVSENANVNGNFRFDKIGGSYYLVRK